MHGNLPKQGRSNAGIRCFCHELIHHDMDILYCLRFWTDTFLSGYIYVMWDVMFSAVLMWSNWSWYWISESSRTITWCTRMFVLMCFFPVYTIISQEMALFRRNSICGAPYNFSNCKIIYTNTNHTKESPIFMEHFYKQSLRQWYDADWACQNITRLPPDAVTHSHNRITWVWLVNDSIVTQTSQTELEIGRRSRAKEICNGNTPSECRLWVVRYSR
jgi:hypothetical protein